MEHMLKPAGDDGLRRALMPLMLSTVMPNMDGMSDDTQQAYFAAKTSEYSRLLSHLPVDIIRDACDAHVMRSKFFPAIAEIMEFAEPAFGHRQRQAKRIDWLIKNGGRPLHVPFVPEPEDVRLRGAIKRYFDHKGTFLFGVLRAGAIKAEKRLAEIEGRPVADWVEAADVEPVVLTTKAPEPATRTLSPSAEAALKRSLAKQHRKQGNTSYAEKLEREADMLVPPEHVDEPLGDEQGDGL